MTSVEQQPEVQKTTEEPKDASGAAMEVDAADAKPDVAEPKEKEQDAASDKRQKVDASAVAVSSSDSTINVMAVAGGKLLMTLTDGGTSNLLAGARATAGVKAGRYMFEVSVVETFGSSWESGRGAQRSHIMRVGFSTAGSSVLLDAAGQASFDDEGTFRFGNKLKNRVAERSNKGDVLAVLLNLDASSPNANTISLFINGQRSSEPMALPEDMHGKVLYPTVSYRQMTLRVNFGPTSAVPLPFTCRMVADAAKDDVELVQVASGKKAAKPEVLFPIGLPGRGFFDFVDMLKASKPAATELSDRSSFAWAAKSGWRGQRQQSGGGSLDKPEMGLQDIETGTVRSVLNSVAPAFSRDFIVPELRANLVASEREVALAQFPKSEFKRTAVVAVGEPNAEFKTYIQSHMLAEKQAVADKEKKKRAQEQERKRLLEERKKKIEAAKKAREAKAKGETAEEAKKDEKKEGEAAPKEDEQAKKEGEEPKKEGEEPKKEGEDAKMEDGEEGEPKKSEEGAAAVDAEMAPAEEPEPEKPVELTEEEKALNFRACETPDLTDWVLNKWFSQFSLPTDTEGFDEVVFAWEKKEAAMKLLRDWVMEKKLTQRVDDLQAGQWFKDAHALYQKCLTEWRKLQGEWKDPAKQKSMLAKKKEGAEGAQEETEKKEAPEIDFDDLDVFAVEDIKDIGNGRPLFSDFVYEDWALLSTFFELHHLLHSFKRDLNDTDRPSFKEKDLAFYYGKYFRKTFDIKAYGVEEFSDFLELVKEVMVVDEATGFFKPVLADDVTAERMMQIVEEDRRERGRRVDAGDETAKLKFQRPSARSRQTAPVGQHQQHQQAPRSYSSGAQHGDRHKGQQGGNYGGGQSGPRRASYGGGEKRSGQYLVPSGKQARTSHTVGSSYPSRR